jgi:hypothetical protein
LAPLTPLRAANGSVSAGAVPAIVQAITAVLPAGSRDVEVLAQVTRTDTAGFRATGRMMLGEGAFIELPFVISAPASTARMQITVDGPASLVVAGSAPPAAESPATRVAEAAATAPADQAVLSELSTSDSIVPGGQEQTRVCPECGRSAGNQNFCAGCGMNLNSLERLPTRADWELGQRLRTRPQALQLAAMIDGLAPLTPMRPGSGSVSEAAVPAIVGAVTAMLPAGAREQPVSAEVTRADGEEFRALGRVVLSDGALVEVPFAISAPANTPRLRVTVDGPSILVADGGHTPIPVPKRSTSRPGGATAPGGMSRADQDELTARRATDAAREAKLHGWKPLTCWYTGWAVLLVIAAISSLAAGSVFAGLFAVLLAAAAGKYAHYLYNGGRRRVWFIFW